MQDNHMLLKPIGYFHGSTDAKHRAPRQPDARLGVDGTIILEKGHNFEQAVQDLDGFSHIWIIYGFHRAEGWKPMVLPPRGNAKRGVFATRSPYRPNPLGLSVVQLEQVQGLTITVKGTDLLDETPIYDIKPYIPYADSHQDAYTGWIDALKFEETTVQISEAVNKIIDHPEINELIIHAKQVLRDSPRPHPYRRIKHIQDDLYELAIQEWRIQYRILGDSRVMIESIGQAGSMK